MSKPIKRKHKQIPAEKLSEYAKQGRGTNAFVPRKTKKRDALQARIDRIVRDALAKEAKAGAGYDVVRHNPQRLRLRLVAKLG
ncbi:MAG: hypothetical protein EDM79_20535 [Chloroflexi bacterium]|nr:MAG: hypothetical protein EDM79_20535 [Chloroflexota bacterium]